MPESEVKSAFEQDVFRPSMCEFVNFSKYITILEEGDLSFALVSLFLVYLLFLCNFHHYFYYVHIFQNVHNKSTQNLYKIARNYGFVKQ